MTGDERKVKKQTTASLIDINRLNLQDFMGFGFPAFMPVLVGCGRPHRAMGLTLSHESHHNHTIFWYLNQNFRSGDFFPKF